VTQGVSQQSFSITPFSSTNNCGPYSNTWTYKGVDNSDGHLLDITSEFIKVDSKAGSIIVS
jgi:hypothetical protein